jgi:dihydroneopterin aldolase
MDEHERLFNVHDGGAIIHDAPRATGALGAIARGVYICVMDIIYINDLRVDTVIGIYDWERRIRQTVSVDLELAADIRRAASSDDIADTINYKAVAKRVLAFIRESEFRLVETLAERIAAIVLNEFNVGWVRVRLNKPGAVRGARDVGVLIERGVRGA